MGRLTRQHLVDHARERILISPGIELVGAAGLFRTHVLWSPQRQAGFRQIRRTSRRHSPCYAKVRYERVGARQQDVPGFDIPMHDTLSVGIGQAVGNLPCDSDRILEGQLPFPIQPVPERFAVHERHDVVEESVSLSRIVHRQDMGMSEASGYLNLPEEPLGTKGDGEFGVQDFDGHLPAVFQVIGEVDRRHATSAKLTLDHVLPGKRCVKTIHHG